MSTTTTTLDSMARRFVQSEPFSEQSESACVELVLALNDGHRFRPPFACLSSLITGLERILSEFASTVAGTMDNIQRVRAASAAAAALSDIVLDFPPARAFFSTPDTVMARNGIYALVRYGIQKGWMERPLATTMQDVCRDPIYMGLACLANLTVNAPIPLKQEVFREMNESLAALIQSDQLDPLRQRSACRNVTGLTNGPLQELVEQQSTTTAVTKPLVSALVSCVASGYGACESMDRMLLDSAIAALANLLMCDSASGDSVATSACLQDGSFGQALRTVQLELLQGVQRHGQQQDEEYLLSAGISVGCSRLVSSMAKSPKVWEYAREQNKALQLVDLVLRQPFSTTNRNNDDFPAMFGCNAIHDLCLWSLGSNNDRDTTKNTAVLWNQFVAEAFQKVKIHKGLIEMIKTGKDDFIGSACSALAQLLTSVERMHVTHGTAPPVLRLYDDKVLLKELVASLRKKAEQVEDQLADTGSYSSRDVRVLGAMAASLHSLGSAGYDFSAKMAVAQAGATRPALLALKVLEDCIKYTSRTEVPRSWETGQETGKDACFSAVSSVMRLLLIVAFLPKEHSKFLAFPDGIGRIVRITCKADKKRKASAGDDGVITDIIGVGIHCLSELGCSQETANVLVDAENGAILSLASSIISETTWPTSSTQMTTKPTRGETWAVNLVGNVVDAHECRVGVRLATDRKLIAGLTNCVERAIQAENSTSAPPTFERCLNVLATIAVSMFMSEQGDDVLSAAANVWHECELFGTAPKVAGIKFQTTESRNLGAIFCIAYLAGIVHHREGKQALVNSGILSLLNRPDAADAASLFMGSDKIGALKVMMTSTNLFSELHASEASSSDGRGRSSDETRQEMMDALGESMIGIMGNLFGSSEDMHPSKKTTAPSHVINDDDKSGASSELLSNLYKEPRHRLRPCANPDCEVVEQPEGPRFQRCTRCKGVRYCSRECQRADWKVHKRTCLEHTVCANTGCTAMEQAEGPRFKRCANCKAVRYCSRECQTADWKSHKVVCATKK